MRTGKLSKTQALAAQTDIRRRLLANGYTALPNVDKQCFFKGWPSITVDEAAIADWSDMGRHLATGIRVQDRLCVLDFDIDDHEALVEIWKRLPKKLRALLDTMPVRFGSGEKFALLCRLAENARRRDLKSGAFSRPGEAKTHRLEIYCGEGPRQFGAFGPHSHTTEGEVAITYEWGSRSLLDTPLDALPEITGPQITALCKGVTKTLDRLGWPIHSSAGFTSFFPSA